MQKSEAPADAPRPASLPRVPGFHDDDDGGGGGGGGKGQEAAVPKASLSGYRPPSWSVAPQKPWALEVIKNGQVIERLRMDAKAVYIIGRLGEAVDVHVRHPTISRQHAVLQHRNNGDVNVMDLSSMHGTRVNRAALEPNVYQPLRVGDILQLGRSSRIYLVTMAESHLTKEQVEVLRRVRETVRRDSVQAGSSALGPAVASPETTPTPHEGITWGIEEDVEVPAEEPAEETAATESKAALPDYLRNDAAFMKYQPHELSISAADVSSRGSKAFKKLEKKVEKLNNLMEENYRIRRKEVDGLSEGQMKRLAQNDARIAQLQDDIAKAEAAHGKKETKTGASAEKKPAEDAGGGEDQDEFYDRTVKSRSRMHGKRVSRFQRAREAAASRAGGLALLGGVEAAAEETLLRAGKKSVHPDSHEGLKLQREALESEEGKLEAEARRMQETLQKYRTIEKADSIDEYVATSTQSAASEELKSLAQRLQLIKTEKRKLDALIELTRPAIDKVSMPRGHPGSGAMEATKSEQSPDKEPEAPEPAATGLPTADSHQPSRRSSDAAGRRTGADDHPRHAQEAQQEVVVEEVEQQQQEPRDTEAAEGDAAMIISGGDESGAQTKVLDKDAADDQEHRDKRKLQEVEETVKPAKRKRILGPSLGPSPFDPHQLEGGDTAWVPPQGQTGDGRTKLNEKYGY